MPITNKTETNQFYTDHILSSNLSDSFSKLILKFFFLPLFLNSFNLIFDYFFYAIAVFDQIRQFVRQIYYFLSQKKVLFSF